MMAPLDQESPSWPGGYEMDMKKQYEEAFRAGQCTVAILATTEDRKRVGHGHSSATRRGHFINLLGHLTVERLA